MRIPVKRVKVVVSLGKIRLKLEVVGCSKSPHFKKEISCAN